MRTLFASLEKVAAISADPRAEVLRSLSFEVADAKAAAVDDRTDETDEDRRNRRVGEFLRRRQPSGLQDGSASPTPPKDATS